MDEKKYEPGAELDEAYEAYFINQVKMAADDPNDADAGWAMELPGPARPFPGDDEKNKNICYLMLGKGQYGEDNHTGGGWRLIQLLDNYTYNKDQLANASICVEIDVSTGEIFSVFYSAQAESLTYEQVEKIELNGPASISDRSVTARENNLVGYYSVDDLVNKPDLPEIVGKGSVEKVALNNGETLNLTWNVQGAIADQNPGFEVVVYDAEKPTPLFSLTIDLPGDYNRAEQTGTFRVTKYTKGQPEAVGGGSYTFPFAYDSEGEKGSATLTLDAMCSAQVLRSVETSDAGTAKKDMLYSITRLIAVPTDIYATVSLQNAADGGEKKSNTENTLFAKESTADKAGIAKFRHLYNIRWMEKAGATAYTLTKALDWFGPATADKTGLPVVYQFSGTGTDTRLVPATPTKAAPVAFPTIPALANGQTLDGKEKTIKNLQLRTDSVAGDEPQMGDGPAWAAQYVGLFGENHGAIQNLTLEDVDAAVNLTDSAEPTAVNAAVKAARETGAPAPNAFAEDKNQRKSLRGVGALCGLSTGELKNVKLTDSATRVDPAATPSGRVAAAVSITTADDFTGLSAKDEETVGTKDKVGKLRGVGGLVGISRPAARGENESAAAAQYGMTNLATAGEVIGLLLDPAQNEGATASTATRETEKNQYAAAQTAYLPVGIGGVAGYVYTASQGTSAAASRLKNSADVTGNMFTGGVAGCLSGESSGTQAGHLEGAENTGVVTASAFYNGASGGCAGQFFGGVAGYVSHTMLTDCTSKTDAAKASALWAGLKKDTATRQALLRGDFVGGLIGYGISASFAYTSADKAEVSGVVLGRSFVGGVCGACAGQGLGVESGTTLTNSAKVAGYRYVGGIVGAAGGGAIGGKTGSEAGGFVNTGLTVGLDIGIERAGDAPGNTDASPACIGGIAGLYDSAWGGAAGAMTNCTSSVAEAAQDDMTALGADKADFVGGLVGYLDGNRVETEADEPLSTILSGCNYIGGVAGYAGPAAKLNISGSIAGKITASGDCAGGLVGLNRSTLNIPSFENVNLTVKALGDYAGGIAGRSYGAIQSAPDGGGRSTLQLASVSAKNYAGGLVGGYQPTGTGTTLQNFTNNTPVLATENGAGGLAGQNTAGSTQSCANNGPVSAGGDFAGGMIGKAAGGSVTDCTNQAEITAEGKYAGGMIGQNQGGGSVSGCTNKGIIRAQNTYAGGIVGRTMDGGSILVCTNEGAVSAGSYAGGIVGNGNTDVQGCTNAGAISASSYAGGVIGQNAGGKIGPFIRAGEYKHTTNTGTVRATGDYAGGIAGQNSVYKDIDNKTQDYGGITGCTSTGAVSAKNFAGGIAGQNARGTTITSSNTELTASTSPAVLIAATGNGTEGYAGGITGVNDGTISDCQVKSLSGTAIIQAYGPERGGAVGVNGETGVVESISLSGSFYLQHGLRNPEADVVGGLIGVNRGTLKNSAITDLPAPKETASKTITFGGAVGVNEKTGKIEGVTARISLTEPNTNSKVKVFGGVVGENKGTATNCTFTGSINQGTPFADGAYGGIAGSNSGEIEASQLKNAGDTQTAIVKAAGGSIGGVAGTNSGTVTDCALISGMVSQTGSEAGSTGGIAGSNEKGAALQGCTVATEGTASVVSAASGNVGGVAGQNDGTISACGGKNRAILLGLPMAAAENGDAQALAARLNKYLNTVSNETPDQDNTDTLAADITTAGAYKAYLGAFGDNALGTNLLTVKLTGGSGAVGGIAGVNGESGSVTESASDKWYVIGRQSGAADVSTAVGGVIGRNENAAAALKGLVNAAYVRRYTTASAGTIAANPENYAVGGVVGSQKGAAWTTVNNDGKNPELLVNCLNLGTVYSRFGSAAGGIVGALQEGGILRSCLNFGDLQADTAGSSAPSTAAGGVVGWARLSQKVDAQLALYNCRNYGSANNAIDKTAGQNGKAGISYAGGMVARATVDSQTVATESKTTKILLDNCINGESAALNAYGTDACAAGIFGYMDGEGSNQTAELIFNRCRNYSTELTAEGLSTTGSMLFTGIYGGREKLPNPTAAYNGCTTMKQCFALYNDKQTQPVKQGGTPTDSPLTASRDDKEFSDKCEGNYFMDTTYSFGKYTGLNTLDRAINMFTVVQPMVGNTVDKWSVANWFDGSAEWLSANAHPTDEKLGETGNLITNSDQNPQIYLAPVVSQLGWFKVSGVSGMTVGKVSYKVGGDMYNAKVLSEEADGWYMFPADAQVAEVYVDFIETSSTVGIGEIFLYDAAGNRLEYRYGKQSDLMVGEHEAYTAEPTSVNGRRLYSGCDGGANEIADRSNYYTYFAADISVDTAHENQYNVKMFSNKTVRVGIEDETEQDKNPSFADPRTERVFWGYDTAPSSGKLPLLFSNNAAPDAGTTGTAGPAAPRTTPVIHDVVDKTLRTYYDYILDKKDPGALTSGTETASAGSAAPEALTAEAAPETATPESAAPTPAPAPNPPATPGSALPEPGVSPAPTAQAAPAPTQTPPPTPEPSGAATPESARPVDAEPPPGAAA